MAKRPKAKVGDIFRIPIDEDRFGIGQVVYVHGSELYLVVYDGCWSEATPPALDRVGDLAVLFASLSLDAKIWHGHWPIIDNQTSNLPSISLPTFKVWHGDHIFAESIDEDISRRASGDEIDRLLPRTTVAPVRLEKALKAAHNVLEWDAAYDDLRYERVQRSASITI